MSYTNKWYARFDISTMVCWCLHLTNVWYLGDVYVFIVLLNMHQNLFPLLSEHKSWQYFTVYEVCVWPCVWILEWGWKWHKAIPGLVIQTSFFPSPGWNERFRGLSRCKCHKIERPWVSASQQEKLTTEHLCLKTICMRNKLLLCIKLLRFRSLFLCIYLKA